jgi:GNAT superfamily N-acetyltransferase
MLEVEPLAKIKMKFLLDDLPERAGRLGPSVARRIRPADEQGLAELMLAAYRGTVDDEGANLEDALGEVKRTFSGGYGDLLWEHSFLAEEGGKVLSASLVTSFEGTPLLAFSMTHPSHKRRGLAGALILKSVRSLREDGDEILFLFVSEGNLPARKLYEKLDFQMVE